MDDFNYYNYINTNPICNTMTITDAWNHYILSIKDELENDIIYKNLDYNNFESTYYINKYPSLNLKDKDSAWHHYTYCGKNEGRIIKPLNKDIRNFTRAIIYVYYCRPNETRNESNLSFFIRQTILKDKNKDILYLFIINNNINEVVIPKKQNVYVIKNKNCFDFEAYGFGIEYIKYLTQEYFCNIKRILLINSSVTGPFYTSGHWLDKFEDKLINEDSVACSNIMYRLKESDESYVNRLPGYLIYFKITEEILDILKGVLSYKKDKIDCIINGEYGFARELIRFDYKISSLINTKYELNKILYRVDRDSNLDYYCLNDLVFIKLVWRSPNVPNRDSLPVKWKYVDSEINRICNYNYDEYCVDYNNIQSPKNGIHDSNCAYNWSNKEIFYKLYGQSEQFITYPIKQKYDKIALYAHSDTDNILRDYCIQGINTLSLLGYKVIICTTCKEFNNCNNLPYSLNYYENCNIDIQMYKLYIDSNYESMLNYKNILLINDSVLFPIHGIENMKKSIMDIRNKCDYWGIWNSPENKEHIMSPVLEFKIKMLKELKTYITLYNPHNWIEGINFELNLLEYFNKLNYKYSVIVDYKTLGELNNQCPIMHPKVFSKWIQRTDVFAIKWKYICNYLNLKSLNNSYMNYLLRFLHFDYSGIQGIPQKHNAFNHPLTYKLELKYFDYNFYINQNNKLKNLEYNDVCDYFILYGNEDKIIFNKLLINFDYKFYTTYYKDLNHFNFIDLCNHFIEYGINENRIFNKNLINFDKCYYKSNYNLQLSTFEIYNDYLFNQHRNKNILSGNCCFSKNIIINCKYLIIINDIDINIKKFINNYLDIIDNYHVVFIINDINIKIPYHENISIIYNNINNNNYLYFTIKQIENKINKELNKQYEYILYLNNHLPELNEYNNIFINKIKSIYKNLYFNKINNINEDLYNY